MNSSVIYFSKVKPDAIIPTKREEDAGYDIYANFEEEYISIFPHETVMIPTGIASAFSNDYVMILKERGSTGTKGIAQRCGVIDSGFRDEWKVPITNTTEHKLVIVKFFTDENEKQEQIEYLHRMYDYDSILYPYKKAITQAVLLPIPKVYVNEIPYEKLLAIKSERRTGMLGSSGK